MPPSSDDNAFAIEPIASIASDYPDKFGVPRQPGLVPAARGVVSLLPPFDDPLAVEGLQAYSHLWLSFVFDRSPVQWRARVRPPRLGGNRRVGVFATRSTHRPNRLGQSLVALLDMVTSSRPVFAPWAVPGAGAPLASRTHLLIAGHDLVDKTPIVDIKPYLPWADSVGQARAALAPVAPVSMRVEFSESARAFIDRRDDGDTLAALIEQVLAQDPRPAYRAAQTNRRFGVALRDVDVGFCMAPSKDGLVAIVLSITPRDTTTGADQPPI